MDPHDNGKTLQPRFCQNRKVTGMLLMSSKILKLTEATFFKSTKPNAQNRELSDHLKCMLKMINSSFHFCLIISDKRSDSSGHEL